MNRHEDVAARIVHKTTCAINSTGHRGPCTCGAESSAATRPHKWRKAPRSLFSTFMCSVCGATSMVKHYGRCSGGS